MSKKRILFVSQEIFPYLPASEISKLGKELPQSMQERGYEVRIFMPKFGAVNERRNQLHEVIRLSGLNIVINDNDHPLIIKVASMQPSRIQVYFIDNDDYFLKSDEDADAVGSNRTDNDERSIFFARGTSETVKKLRWDPVIVHCSGWITAITPLYLRGMAGDDEAFKSAKIVYSVLPGEISGGVDPEVLRKIADDGIDVSGLETVLGENPDTDAIHRLAISQADGVIFHTPEPSADLLEYVKQRGIPYLTAADIEAGPDAYAAFYKTLQEDEN